MAGRPKAEIPTAQLSFRLREDEHALLRAACERLGTPGKPMSPGRLLGRMIRAAYAPLPAEPNPVTLESLMNRSEEE